MQPAAITRNPLDPCSCGTSRRHRGVPGHLRWDCFMHDFYRAKNYADNQIETLESSVTFFKGIKAHCTEADRELGDAETSVAELAKALRAAEQRRERARSGVRSARQLLEQASAQCFRASRGAAVASTQFFDAEVDYVDALPGFYKPADVEAKREVATVSVNARLRATRIGVQRWGDMSGNDADRAAAHAVYASLIAAVGKARLAEVMNMMNVQAKLEPASGQQIATQQTKQQPTTKKKGKNSKKKRNNNRSEPYARPEAYARSATKAEAVREVTPVQPKREEMDEGGGCSVATKAVQSVTYPDGGPARQPEGHVVNLDYEQVVEHADDSGYQASPDHEHSQEHIDQTGIFKAWTSEDDRMYGYDEDREPEQDGEPGYDEQQEYDEEDERYGQDEEYDEYNEEDEFGGFMGNPPFARLLANQSKSSLRALRDCPLAAQIASGVRPQFLRKCKCCF